MEYVKHGLKHMQLEFYIEGSEPGLKGTVHVESKEVCVCHILEAIFECCRHIEPQCIITTQINFLWATFASF